MPAFFFPAYLSALCWDTTQPRRSYISLVLILKLMGSFRKPVEVMPQAILRHCIRVRVERTPLELLTLSTVPPLELAT